CPLLALTVEALERLARLLRRRVGAEQLLPRLDGALLVADLGLGELGDLERQRAAARLHHRILARRDLLLGLAQHLEQLRGLAARRVIRAVEVERRGGGRRGLEDPAE